MQAVEEQTTEANAVSIGGIWHMCVVERWNRGKGRGEKKKEEEDLPPKMVCSETEEEEEMQREEQKEQEKIKRELIRGNCREEQEMQRKLIRAGLQSQYGELEAKEAEKFVGTKLKN